MGIALQRATTIDETTKSWYVEYATNSEWTEWPRPAVDVYENNENKASSWSALCPGRVRPLSRNILSAVAFDRRVRQPRFAVSIDRSAISRIHRIKTLRSHKVRTRQEERSFVNVEPSSASKSGVTLKYQEQCGSVALAILIVAALSVIQR